MADYPQLTIRSRAELRGWLVVNHRDAAGVWLVRFKKGKGAHVAYDDVVDEAIAFGWIDSQPRSLDDQRSQLLITPRKKGSRWSKTNKERVARLRAAGLMSAAGEAAVQRSELDGTWDALNEVEALEEPEDLRRALDARAPACEDWDAFPRSTRRAILEWIHAAKRGETRARRIADTVEKASVNVRANQWRQPGGENAGPRSGRSR
jgi:uncharacterized protein YdeI (YjbR/CyaY-like superfamily)